MFHFKRYQLTFAEIAQAITKASGEAVKVKRFPWRLLRLIAPFSELFKGLVEMRYLWEPEINLCDDKLREVVEVRQMPLAEALVESGLVEAVEFGLAIRFSGGSSLRNTDAFLSIE